MAASAQTGSCLFLMEHPFSLRTHFFPGGTDYRAVALSYAHFRSPGGVIAVSAADSSSALSSQPVSYAKGKLKCLEESEFMNTRRTFAAFVGILSPAAFFLKARADEPPIINDQFEEMQQELIEKNLSNEAVSLTKDITEASFAASLSEAYTWPKETPRIQHNINFTSVIKHITGNSALQEKFSISQGGVSEKPTEFLGILGLLGAAVFGPLYRLERDRTYRLKIILQDMTVKLKEIEDAMKSSAEQVECKLADVKEQDLQELRESKQKIAGLKNDLLSKEYFADSLVERLKAEKKLCEDQDEQIKSLQISVEVLKKQIKEAIESRLSEEENKASQLQEENAKLKSELDQTVDDLDLLRLVWKEQALIFKDRVLAQLKPKIESLSQADSKDVLEEVSEIKNGSQNGALTTDSTVLPEQQALASAKTNQKMLEQKIVKAKEEYDSFKKSSGQEMMEAKDIEMKLKKEVEDLERKLAAATSKADELEAEKSCLSVSLDEVRRLSETLMDKVNLIDAAMRQLSKEREMHADQAERLEEELSSTEGEMLRLQEQITLMGNERTEDPSEEC